MTMDLVSRDVAAIRPTVCLIEAKIELFCGVDTDVLGIQQSRILLFSFWIWRIMPIFNKTRQKKKKKVRDQ